jgi:hypothetical protein
MLNRDPRRDPPDDDAGAYEAEQARERDLVIVAYLDGDNSFTSVLALLDAHYMCPFHKGTEMRVEDHNDPCQTEARYRLVCPQCELDGTYQRYLDALSHALIGYVAGTSNKSISAMNNAIKRIFVK